jgi:hypothetical protein
MTAFYTMNLDFAWGASAVGASSAPNLPVVGVGSWLIGLIAFSSSLLAG